MQEKKRIQTTDVCDTLLARDYKDPKCVPVEDLNPIRLGGLYDTEDGKHQAGAIWDKDAISPTLDTMQGGNRQPFIVTEEPFIVASRGRNPENPSDRTVGVPTEQRLEPNFSGCSNTLTSVQKDNYVCEPMIIQNPHGFNNGQIREDCPSITSSCFQENNYVASPIVYDDYNSRISADQDAINTLTCNCGASAERNGVKIIEPVIVEDFYQSREPRVYTETAPTIRSERVGLKAADGVVEKEPQLEFVGGLGDKDWAKDGKQLSRNYPQGSRVYSSDGIASALTAQGVGGAGGYSGLYAVEDPKIRWRIRKLTAKECWRLMNFTDNDVDRASSFVSDSSLYKQAGNSIVTACLISIMSSLFIEDGHKAEVWTKYALHFND